MRDGDVPHPALLFVSQDRQNMSNDQRTRERISEIEDRKIELLLETGRTNKRYSETISRLDSEYKRLDGEHYQLRFELMKARAKDDPI
jgi:hypothetical protein